MIADIRFINEAQYILNNNGLLFKVYSPARNLDRLLKEVNYVYDDIKHDFESYNNLNNYINNIIENIDNNDNKKEKLNKLKLMINHDSEISLDKYNNYHLIINNNYNFNNYNELYKILESYIILNYID